MVEKISERKIAVIGGDGNMGRRYMTILKFLGVDCYSVDLKNDNAIQGDTDGFIVATPTETHYDILWNLREYDKPVLCEKPITKYSAELREILSWDDMKLRMINQYEYYLIGRTYSIYSGHTYYNFYHSGTDGAYWDHINIIGLAGSPDKVSIKNDSPLWECWINGIKLSKDFMDYAYVWNLEDWIEKFDDNKHYIKEAHERVWGIVNEKHSNLHTDQKR